LKQRISIRRILGALACVLAIPSALLLAGYADGRAIDRKHTKARQLETIALRLNQERPSIRSLTSTFGQPSSIKRDMQSWTGDLFSAANGRQSGVLDLTFEFGFRPLPWSRPYVAYLEVRYSLAAGEAIYTSAQAGEVWY
jgi:hypothetical protein